MRAKDVRPRAGERAATVTKLETDRTAAPACPTARRAGSRRRPAAAAGRPRPGRRRGRARHREPLDAARRHSTRPPTANNSTLGRRGSLVAGPARARPRWRGERRRGEHRRRRPGRRAIASSAGDAVNIAALGRSNGTHPSGSQVAASCQVGRRTLGTTAVRPPAAQAAPTAAAIVNPCFWMMVPPKLLVS